ncbi:hypothetical protein [Streptomyces sp. NRRL S-237]|uniref:hypothetical protein n=1 Tax=Streptomyces sp. NRRL S-237 TaxID=1463895 RepID=UPI00131C81D4|nr:hypothetical protein [Streptomyces sp. NRRL S-237]
MKYAITAAPMVPMAEAAVQKTVLRYQGLDVGEVVGGAGLAPALAVALPVAYAAFMLSTCV